MEDDFALVAPSNEISLVKRTRPTLTRLGDRIVPSDGRWHPDLVAQYVRDHGGRERWIPVGELAKVFFFGNHQSNRTRVRRRLHHVFRILLDQGELMVVELHQRDGALACKLYDPQSLEERQYLASRIGRMEKHNFLKAEQLEKALRLAQCLESVGESVR